jgi:hypothetical protein
MKNKTSANLQKLPSWRGKLEGTINTLKQRAQKITHKTKLPKISKKLPSWRGELEGTINTPSEGTNNYVQNKTSKISKKSPSWRGQQIPHLLHIFLTLSSIQQWTLGEGVMILAYLGQTPEVPRTDLRAKHHL